MTMRALGFIAVALAVLPALALEKAQWPPPPETQQRMRELQQAIIDPASTMQQRNAARQELSGLLRSPAGQPRADEKPARPARAAIDPFPSVVKPYERVTPPTPPEGVARVEVIEPPKPVIIPQTGGVALPNASGFAIDTHGNVLHPAPGGWVDPRSGRFVPR
jgi:hypothetical protein